MEGIDETNKIADDPDQNDVDHQPSKNKPQHHKEGDGGKRGADTQSLPPLSSTTTTPSHQNSPPIHHPVQKESGIQAMKSGGQSGGMNAVLPSSSRASLLHLPSEGSTKHLTMGEGSISHPSPQSVSDSPGMRSSTSSDLKAQCKKIEASASSAVSNSDKKPQSPPNAPDRPGIAISPQQKPEEHVVSTSVVPPASAGGSGGGKDTGKEGSEESSATSAPLKATNFGHLRQKYIPELEYMLTEFKKLERQLLGAKAATRESAGSRERREKLHSFIIHLEDTINQIHKGCKLEAEGKSTISDPVMADSALIQPTQEKKEEENVQKLEEHILANLLPVKVRLKKQLAAQQGAKHNPAGMPVRGSLAPAHQPEAGKATFAIASASGASVASKGDNTSKSRSLAASAFGKPLEGGGSRLTKNLHGATLGSTKTNATTTVQAAVNMPDKETTATIADSNTKTNGKEGTNGNKILFAGMAIGSDQISSSVDAASSAHQMVINDPALLELARKQAEISEKADSSVETSDVAVPKEAISSPVATAAAVAAGEAAASTIATSAATPAAAAVAAAAATIPTKAAVPSTQPPPIPAVAVAPAPAVVVDSAKTTNISSYEERLRLKKMKKRKRKRQADEKTKDSDSKKQSQNKRKKGVAGSKSRGPRPVEYMCALCNEVYSSTCDYNPWWALQQQECPKCHKMQIPRIDISAPANAIEYHPALLAHIEDNGGGANSTPPAQVSTSKPASVTKESSDTDSCGSDLSDEDWDGILSDDDSMSSEEPDPETMASMSAAEKAEIEKFGAEYDGPKLTEKESARLLILMAHASTCPCRHKLAEQRDICRSTKWMMLHVRDCPGTTSTFDVCPFPWCRKVKHLLYHLVSCQEPETCAICSPKNVTGHMMKLKGLNEHRLNQYRERLIARAKAIHLRAKSASSAKSGKPAAVRAAAAKPIPGKPHCRQVIVNKAAPQKSATTLISKPVVTPKPAATGAAVTALPKVATAQGKPSPSNAMPPPSAIPAGQVKVTMSNAVVHAESKAPHEPRVTECPKEPGNGPMARPASAVHKVQVEPLSSTNKTHSPSIGVATTVNKVSTPSASNEHVSPLTPSRADSASHSPGTETHAESLAIDAPRVSEPSSPKAEQGVPEEELEAPCLSPEDHVKKVVLNEPMRKIKVEDEHAETIKCCNDAIAKHTSESETNSKAEGDTSEPTSVSLSTIKEEAKPTTSEKESTCPNISATATKLEEVEVNETVEHTPIAPVATDIAEVEAEAQGPTKSTDEAVALAVKPDPGCEAGGSDTNVNTGETGLSTMESLNSGVNGKEIKKE